MRRTFSKFAIVGAAFVVLIGLTVLITGKPAMVPGAGVVDDWSFHHLVFSHPGSAPEALAQGRIEQWYRIVNDPRYIMQQIKRNPAQEALGPEPDFATLASRLGAPIADPGRIRKPPPPTPKQTLNLDWNVTLGTGGTVGAGQYPAKFSYNGAANCTDFIVFNTSLAGSSTSGSKQATVIAYTKLYSTGTSPCTSVPSVAWAYNTTNGDKVVTSVVLSGAGDQAAFMSTDGSHAYLNVLLFESGQGTAYNSPVSPTPSTSGSAYSTCKSSPPASGCLLRLEFLNGANDTTSSPFYDYSGADTLYVGDASGNVHKFTSVFNGSPLESHTGTTTPWASVGASTALTSPVYDGTHVFVGGKNGILYSILASSAVSTSRGQLDFGFGITDASLVDRTAAELYVPVGDDGTTDCVNTGGLIPCQGAYQISTSGSTENEVQWGNYTTTVPMYAGTFDNIYYAEGASTGHYFFCGIDSAASGPSTSTSALIEIPTTTASGGAFLVNLIGAYAYVTTGTGNPACSPVTENLSGGSDWVFLSVAAYPNYAASGCTKGSTSAGCIYNYNVGNGTTTFPFGCGTLASPTLNCGSTSTPTAGFAVGNGTNGTSGIIIDNSTTSGTVTGANIYFTTSTAPPCASGGCGVQVTQAAP